MIKPKATDQRGREIASTLLPTMVSQPTDSRRVLRRWVLRVRRDATDLRALEKAEQSAVARIRASLLHALGARHTAEVLARSVPELQLEPIDEAHLLIHAFHPHRNEEAPDALLIVMAEMIKAIDSELEIEDIQGVPKRYWILVSP
jgi:hypothetical protein